MPGRAVLRVELRFLLVPLSRREHRTVETVAIETQSISFANRLKGGLMRVAEIMTRDVEIVNPDDTLQTAAKMMGEINAGALPVGANNRLIGMITDRDIAVRAVGEGLDPRQSKVGEVMTAEVHYCFEDEDTDSVSVKMADLRVRRLPVLNREKRLVGIVALGDLAVEDQDGDTARKALKGVSQPQR